MRMTDAWRKGGWAMGIRVTISAMLSVNLIFMSTVAFAIEKKSSNEARALGRQAARLALWPGKAKKAGPIEGVFLLDPSKPDLAGQLRERDDATARFAGLCLKRGRELTGDNPLIISNERANGSVQIFGCGGRQLFVATLKLKKVAPPELRRVEGRELHVYRPAVHQLAPAALCTSPNPDACLGPEGPDVGGDVAKGIGVAAGVLIVIGVGYGIYEGVTTDGSFWSGFANGFMEIITLGEWDSGGESGATDGEGSGAGSGEEGGDGASTTPAAGAGMPVDPVDTGLGRDDSEEYADDNWCSAEQNPEDPDCAEHMVMSSTSYQQ